MSDLIDREALRNALYEADAVTMEGVKIINTFPAVEPKKGEWIELNDGYLVAIKCSACNEEFVCFDEDFSKTNFCPHCGADMRGEADGR